jgi:hypothetical protein
MYMTTATMLQNHYFAVFGLVLLSLWSFTSLLSNAAAASPPWPHADNNSV